MLALPAHWATAPPSRLAAVGTGPSLLLLDYDGTLAPFQDDRMQARPWSGVTERLERLNALPSVQLVLITGRLAFQVRGKPRVGKAGNQPVKG